MELRYQRLSRGRARTPGDGSKAQRWFINHGIARCHSSPSRVFPCSAASPTRLPDSETCDGLFKTSRGRRLRRRRHRRRRRYTIPLKRPSTGDVAWETCSVYASGGQCGGDGVESPCGKLFFLSLSASFSRTVALRVQTCGPASRGSPPSLHHRLARPRAAGRARGFGSRLKDDNPSVFGNVKMDCPFLRGPLTSSLSARIFHSEMGLEAEAVSEGRRMVCAPLQLCEACSLTSAVLDGGSNLQNDKCAFPLNEISFFFF